MYSVVPSSTLLQCRTGDGDLRPIDKSDLLSIFVNKDLLKHSYDNFLKNIVYDYFCAMTIELNGCDRDLTTLKA